MKIFDPQLQNHLHMIWAVEIFADHQIWSNPRKQYPLKKFVSKKTHKIFLIISSFLLPPFLQRLSSFYKFLNNSIPSILVNYSCRIKDWEVGRGYIDKWFKFQQKKNDEIFINISKKCPQSLNPQKSRSDRHLCKLPHKANSSICFFFIFYFPPWSGGY